MGRMRPPLLAVLVAAAVLPGCAYYSFSGATIPEHLGTISIPIAEDNTISTLTGLDDRMTELLVDRFVRQTRLSLESDTEQADALLRVTLAQYRNLPTSVSGDEQATRNRITITARALYTDRTSGETLLDRTFSSFEEYDPFEPAQEETAALAALEKIADDIFTAATSNW
ncbi:MAG: LptE family protein [Rhodothermales bacterium]|nr:LptE family protein [Rhodothermales bacterium]